MRHFTFFTLKKSKSHTTNQKYSKPINNKFVFLFILTLSETWACLDSHKTEILGGIEVEKQAFIPLKIQSLDNGTLLLGEIG